jgi:galactokinase
LKCILLHFLCPEIHFQFSVRAPGRVNLIGEHVDYSGYGVLPMAIDQDCFILVRLHSSSSSVERSLNVAHINVDKFPPRQFANASAAIEIDKSKHEWSNYFLAGYKVCVYCVRRAVRPIFNFSSISSLQTKREYWNI